MSISSIISISGDIAIGCVNLVGRERIVACTLAKQERRIEAIVALDAAREGGCPFASARGSAVFARFEAAKASLVA